MYRSRQYKQRFLVTRKRHVLSSLVLYDRKSSLGVTLWRGFAEPGGWAVSFQFRGRFAQLVFGDWWKAYDGT